MKDLQKAIAKPVPIVSVGTLSRTSEGEEYIPIYVEVAGKLIKARIMKIDWDEYNNSIPKQQWVPPHKKRVVKR